MAEKSWPEEKLRAMKSRNSIKSGCSSNYGLHTFSRSTLHPQKKIPNKTVTILENQFPRIDKTLTTPPITPVL